MRLIFLLTSLLLLPGVALAADGREASLQIRQLTPELLESEGLLGVNAIGGSGDWLLSNGTVCAVISDPAHPTYLSASGGVLIDFGYCGRNDDQWNTYHDLLNLSQSQVLGCQRLEQEIDQHSASLHCITEQHGLERRWSYRLNLEQPERLQMESRIRRLEAGPRLFLYGTIALHPHASLSPFAIDSQQPQRNRGFRLPTINLGSVVSILRNLSSADHHILLGADHNGPPISYALTHDQAYIERADGGRNVLKSFSLRDQYFTLSGYVRSNWLPGLSRGVNLWDLLQSLWSDLKTGETMVLRQSLSVAPSADTRVHSNHAYRRSGGNTEDYLLALRGNATSAMVESSDGIPFSWLHFQRDEQIALSLPADRDYQLRLDTNGQVLPLRAVTHFEAPADSRATLELPDSDILLLTFKGIDGTPDPVFFRNQRPLTISGQPYYGGRASNQIAIVPGHSPAQVMIPEGQYQVYASRGPEFQVNSRRLSLLAGERQRLAIGAPERALQQSRWRSADFHVHTAHSFDSTLPAREQIMRFAAQGAEVLVASEHRRTIDLSPVLRQLGLEQTLITLPGVELTSMARTERAPQTIGHANVFPVEPVPGAHLGGTVRHNDRYLGEVIADYRQQHPGSVFQLNHPRRVGRGDAGGSFFDHHGEGFGHDPEQPLDSAANRHLLQERAGPGSYDLAFDAIELLNGQVWESYTRVREDWFALLRQGHRKTGTANSDSHAASETVGLPRNYVYTDVYTDVSADVDTGEEQTFDQHAFAQAIREGRLYGSSGPLLEVQIGDAGIGDTYTGTEGLLRVRALTPDWFTVDSLRVFINGELHIDMAIAPGQATEIPLQFVNDSFVVVEVQGPASDIYRAIYPHFYPFAFSNPIYVTVDGEDI